MSSWAGPFTDGRDASFVGAAEPPHWKSKSQTIVVLRDLFRFTAKLQASSSSAYAETAHRAGVFGPLPHARRNTLANSCYL
jgi:hypothetical protein